MELKKYQQDVLRDIDDFIDKIERCPENIKEAFRSFWEDRNVNINSLNSQYLGPYKDTVSGVPRVTVKVPTAGGKTFIACNALERFFSRYPVGKPKVVAWFVPSDPILVQTYENLSDPANPYRRKLNSLFNNNVCVVSKEDALRGQGISPIQVQDQLTIFVLSVQSFATKTKDGRRVYRENENLTAYTRLYGEMTQKVEGADETSLIQVLSYLNPLVIVDESHNFTADLRVEMLNAINPNFILELTATPRENSNIISFVDAVKLKREHMVKLPVIVYNHKTTDDVICSAIQLQSTLEEKAKEQERTGGKYIRPIVLFQAQPNSADDNVTFDKIKKTLIEIGIPAEQIKIRTSGNNELKNIDLMSRDCPVRYIITVDALKEGWDCPFAYILASLANKTSRVSVEQILGRILRLPYTCEHKNLYLNLSYVFTSSADFRATLDDIIKSLNKAGFSKKDYKIIEEQAVETSESQLSDNATTESDLFELGYGLHEPEGGILEDESFPSVSLNAQSIKDRLNDSGENNINSDVKKIEEFAARANEEYGNALKATENANDLVPNEIKEMAGCYFIKDCYREKAFMVKLPIFKKKVSGQNSVFEDDVLLPLTKEMLEEGFSEKMSKLDHDIDFKRSDVQAQSIDLDESGSSPVRRKLDEKQLEFIREAFAQYRSDRTRQNQVIDQITKGLGKYKSISDSDLRLYVKTAIEGKTNEELEDIVIYSQSSIAAVANKLDSLLLEYRKDMFKKWLDLEMIVCESEYEFHDTQTVPNKLIGLPKGLYEEEENVNGFENEILTAISNLDNVVFWHRNPERGVGFGINGFINHYPDFIVYLKSGKIILVETKGDDRDNSDSKLKIELGSYWQNKAGDQYRYYMVFDTQEVEGALTKDKFLERLKSL